MEDGQEQVEEIVFTEEVQRFLTFMPSHSTTYLLGCLEHKRFDWLDTYSDDSRVKAKMREAISKELDIRIPPRMTAEEIKRNLKAH